MIFVGSDSGGVSFFSTFACVPSMMHSRRLPSRLDAGNSRSGGLSSTTASYFGFISLPHFFGSSLCVFPFVLPHPVLLHPCFVRIFTISSTFGGSSFFFFGRKLEPTIPTRFGFGRIERLAAFIRTSHRIRSVCSIGSKNDLAHSPPHFRMAPQITNPHQTKTET